MRACVVSVADDLLTKSLENLMQAEVVFLSEAPKDSIVDKLLMKSIELRVNLHFCIFAKALTDYAYLQAAVLRI